MSILNVIESLKSLNKIHEDLLETAQEKKSAIIANDMATLTRLMTRENRLLKQVEHAEELRVASTDSFLKEKGIRSKLNLNITEIARLVFDPIEKQELLNIRDELTNNIHVLKRQNELIQQMIEQSMQFIDFSLNIFLEVEDDLIYQKPTQQPSGYKKNNFFDTKA